MARFDVAVRGGTLVAPGGVSIGDVSVGDVLIGDVSVGGVSRADRGADTGLDIGIQGGAIVEIGPELPGDARQELDARGLHVFPGIVDAHVHFNEPGRSEWEGFACGSQALASGGGTTYLDMPLNSVPLTLDGASFDVKARAAAASSLVDFGLWGGLVPGNVERLPELAARGAVGVKAFMADSGLPEFPPVDEPTLRRGMAAAAALGLLVAVHAESDATVRAQTARIRGGDGRSPRDFLASRPLAAEVEAIELATALAAETGARLHVVHVSSGAGVAAVAAARARGVDVTCETCPHYLLLTEGDVERLGAVAKCAPPLRSAAERERLWGAVARGEVQLVASDHSPSAPGLKEREDFFEAWGGISGVQSTLAALLTEGHFARGLTLEAIATLCATAPARRFGLWPRKGALRVGADADLALVDLRDQRTLLAADLLTRHPLSPYVGQTFRGTVRRTLLRGETVALDGRPVGRPRGRLLRPAPLAA